ARRGISRREHVERSWILALCQINHLGRESDTESLVSKPNVASRCEHPGEVGDGRRKMWTRQNGPAKISHGLRFLAAVAKGDAQVVERRGVGGIDPYRLLQVRERLDAVAHLEQNPTEVVVRERVIGFDGQR